MRWGSLRRYPKPPNRDGLRAFGAHNSLFLSPSYYSSPNLSPQFNIPRIANGSKQPPDPTPSTLCASFPDLRDLNCMGPLTYFPVIRPLVRLEIVKKIFFPIMPWDTLMPMQKIRLQALWV